MDYVFRNCFFYIANGFFLFAVLSVGKLVWRQIQMDKIPCDLVNLVSFSLNLKIIYLSLKIELKRAK